MQSAIKFIFPGAHGVTGEVERAGCVRPHEEQVEGRSYCLKLMEGMEKTEPGSSCRYKVLGQDAMEKSWNVEGYMYDFI